MTTTDDDSFKAALNDGIMIETTNVNDQPVLQSQLASSISVQEYRQTKDTLIC
jgi:hypothetical protein